MSNTNETQNVLNNNDQAILVGSFKVIKLLVEFKAVAEKQYSVQYNEHDDEIQEQYYTLYHIYRELRDGYHMTFDQFNEAIKIVGLKRTPRVEQLIDYAVDHYDDVKAESQKEGN